ncbi:hypothetical protein PCYB_031550, partial [Plasmodium cynomolgi strain B]
MGTKNSLKEVHSASGVGYINKYDVEKYGNVSNLERSKREYLPISNPNMEIFHSLNFENDNYRDPGEGDVVGGLRMMKERTVLSPGAGTDIPTGEPPVANSRSGNRAGSPVDGHTDNCGDGHTNNCGDGRTDNRTDGRPDSRSVDPPHTVDALFSANKYKVKKIKETHSISADYKQKKNLTSILPFEKIIEEQEIKSLYPQSKVQELCNHQNVYEEKGRYNLMSLNGYVAKGTMRKELSVYQNDIYDYLLHQYEQNYRHFFDSRYTDQSIFKGDPKEFLASQANPYKSSADGNEGRDTNGTYIAGGILNTKNYENDDDVDNSKRKNRNAIPRSSEEGNHSNLAEEAMSDKLKGTHLYRKNSYSLDVNSANDANGTNSAKGVTPLNGREDNTYQTSVEISNLCDEDAMDLYKNIGEVYTPRSKLFVYAVKDDSEGERQPMEGSPTDEVLPRLDTPLGNLPLQINKEMKRIFKRMKHKNTVVISNVGVKTGSTTFSNNILNSGQERGFFGGSADQRNCVYAHVMARDDQSARAQQLLEELIEGVQNKVVQKKVKYLLKFLSKKSLFHLPPPKEKHKEEYAIQLRKIKKEIFINGKNVENMYPNNGIYVYKYSSMLVYTINRRIFYTPNYLKKKMESYECKTLHKVLTDNFLFHVRRKIENKLPMKPNLFLTLINDIKVEFLLSFETLCIGNSNLKRKYKNQLCQNIDVI